MLKARGFEKNDGPQRGKTDQKKQGSA